MKQLTPRRWRKMTEKAILSLNVKEARKIAELGNGLQVISTISDKAILISLHKQRLHHPKATEAQRQESQVWLVSRGYGTELVLGGNPHES